ncbi:ABC transporter ATP-binding protein [soil metagenome]
MTLFSASHLTKRFGALVATDDVSVDVTAGEVHALIGPNGAGKSTLVNLISGLAPADSGSIVLDGVDLTSVPAHRRVDHGLSRCFQITSVFRSRTVLDNLRLAVQSRRGSSLRAWRPRDADSALTDAAVSLAAQVGIDARLDAIAGTLSHGAQRRLDVALALAGTPKLLLLDEPMAGMGAEESAEMVTLIGTLRTRMAILLVEHDMDAVFRLADRITVLVYGRVLVSGPPDEIRGHPQVQAVYLGTEAP